MNTVLRTVFAAAIALAAAVPVASQASVVIGGTRVVYPAQEKEVTVRLTNEGERAALVQVWLDDGDEKSTPDTAKVPFTIAAPVFRLNGGKQQSVRIMATAPQLPADRETLYWLNVLEVPPKADAEGRNILQFAFRTRIKMFYRPAGLKTEINAAPEQLRWSVAASADGTTLKVENPTPYHINFADVGLDNGGTLVGSKGGGMVAPMSSTTFVLDANTPRPAAGAKVSFSTISDFGALRQATAPLQP